METDLIRCTKLEGLVIGYRMETELENAKDMIAREVRETFHFLALLGKPYSPMTLEEFNVAQEELIKECRIRLDENKQKLDKLYFFRPGKRLELLDGIRRDEFLFKNKHKMDISENTFLRLV